jgi:hypothetical protein
VKFRSSDWWDIASVVGITLVVWLCYAVVAASPRLFTALNRLSLSPIAAPVYYKVGQSACARKLLQRSSFATPKNTSNSSSYAASRLA